MKTLKSYLYFFAIFSATLFTSCSKDEGDNPSANPDPDANPNPTNPSSGVMVSTLAGSGISGIGDGAPAIAQFQVLRSLAVDWEGNIYVDDFAVRKVSPTGNVTTTKYSYENNLSSLCGDKAGNIYVASWFNNIDFAFGGSIIKKISPQGTTTFGDTLDFIPRVMAVDNEGNVFALNEVNFNYQIFKITPQGAVSLYAGRASDTLNAPIEKTTLGSVRSFNFDEGNNLYITDNSYQISKITPQGKVSIFAGSGIKGIVNGTANTVQFSVPIGLVIDKQGNVYVTDFDLDEFGLIRKITPDGVVSTLAGIREDTFADGPADKATFNRPEGLAIDSEGNLYVGDSHNYRLRKITLK